MIRFIIGVATFMAVLIVGALLGVTPSFAETVLIVAACVLSDAVDEVLK